LSLWVTALQRQGDASSHQKGTSMAIEKKDQSVLNHITIRSAHTGAPPPSPTDGLILGYGGANSHQIHDGISTLRMSAQRDDGRY
jgi:hypothetical protein